MLPKCIITAILLLAAVPNSHTQNDREHSIGNPFKIAKLGNLHPVSRNVRKVVEDYSEYSDYGLAGRQDPSKYQKDDNNQDASEQVAHSIRRSKDNQPGLVDSLHVVESWPDGSKQLGQLSAVSIDVDGNVVVFHRGDRVWNGQTFLENNVYNQRNLGPIPQNTIVTFDAATGTVLNEWGSGMFYMPHGLTVDKENNIWVTDVALHQVFKFAANTDPGKPVMTLGVPFTPGNDNTHFCKPSDVVIMLNGDFFVSDGYCNTRIIKYSKSGQILMQWGRSTFNSGIAGKIPLPYEFNVPHALALAEDKNMVCAADRENGRLQCFNCHNGSFVMQLHSPKFGPRVFSVAYSPVQGGLLYLVNGPAYRSNVKVKGFVISLVSNEIVEEFMPSETGFSNPHDLAVSSNGNDIYVVELNPYKVWKFHRGNLNTTSEVKSRVSSVGTPLHDDHKSSSTKGLRGSSSNITKVVIEPLRRLPQPPTSIPTVVGIILVVIVIAGIVLAAAVIRMKKRGKENIYSDEHTTKYSKLLE